MEFGSRYQTQSDEQHFNFGDHQRNDDIDRAFQTGRESTLQRFHSDEVKDYKVYKYTALASDKKRIRLLELQAGDPGGREIYCELFQVDYDDTFHVPMRVKENGSAQKRKAEADVGDSDNVKRPKTNTTWTNRNEDTQEEAEQRRDLETSGLKLWEDGATERLAGKQKKKEDGEREYHALQAEVNRNRISYEALSWSWGRDVPQHSIFIRNKGRKSYRRKLVTKELALALKFLRTGTGPRILWIDAICIDQDNVLERNHQVQMMSRVYSRAERVCVWLGEDKPSTKTAFDFMKNHITKLKHFDMICSDKRFSPKWQALLELMQADWFFRRWVIQEIAFARDAIVYCGPEKIPWKDFAVAVELFVEVETATHRLSEIMQDNEKSRHIHGWFEHVSELGASLLVDATGKVFRAHSTHRTRGIEGDDRAVKEEDSESESMEPEQEKATREEMEETKPIDPLERRSLLSLEYLVSTMFIFRATEPRDVIYSLIAIARDATPFAEDSLIHYDKRATVLTLLDSFLEEKPFFVDYGRPYSDVCRDFVQFAISQKHKIDPVQALDILCRPWALSPEIRRSIRAKDYHKDKPKQTPKVRDTWRARKSKIQFNKEKQRYELYKEASDPWEADPRDTRQYGEDLKNPKSNWEFTFEDGKEWKLPDQTKWKRIQERCDELFETRKKREDIRKKMKKSGASGAREIEVDIPLPTWVAQASDAPFSLYRLPGIENEKAGRANADPLVGPPSDGQRNYSAAQTKGLDLHDLKFRKRTALKHYSLYVRGFILDEVVEREDASQLGNIPEKWLQMANWEKPYNTEPPAALWRTLVADRGRDNKNPPSYYARACMESVAKGGASSKSINTQNIITNEQNSIMAEFCRRTQAVIWGRRMFKTKTGLLGLAAKVDVGDKVCILFGCTVPVILKRQEKKKGEDKDGSALAEILETERFEDQMEILKSCVRRAQTNRKRRIRSRQRISDKYLGTNEWYQMLKDREIAVEKLKEFEAIDKAREKKPAPIGKVPTEEESDFEKAKREAQEEDPGVYYYFNGDCYVHGMMDGEALRQKYYNGLPDRIFELR